jgi:hypothetical protein
MTTKTNEIYKIANKAFRKHIHSDFEQFQVLKPAVALQFLVVLTPVRLYRSQVLSFSDHAFHLFEIRVK